MFWTLTDHLNTVRDLAVFDAETGVTTIANHIVYDAFGRVTSQTNVSVTTLFGFTGRPLDSDTGLQNNLNRWYDAETGTWISEDPIGFAAADVNLYRYCGNQVTVAVDPSGLYWNWGNPFSKPMWDLFYYWDIENEAKESAFVKSACVTLTMRWRTLETRREWVSIKRRALSSLLKPGSKWRRWPSVADSCVQAPPLSSRAIQNQVSHRLAASISFQGERPVPELR